MLLGPAGVGKSSLKRGLMNLKFNRKTTSTIVADVQSVRPVEYNWASAVRGSEEWKDVTPNDELNELAQLIARVHKTQGSVNMLPSTAAAGTFSSLVLFPEMNIEALEEASVTKSISEAISRATRMSHHDVELQSFFHIWDCGGQPVFLEVLPAFLTSRTMFLLLFDASKDLNSRWRSVQYQQGRKIRGEKVNITIIELLQKWMSGIHAHLARVNEKGALLEYPRIIAIGSRGDKLRTKKKSKVKEDLRSKLESAAFGEIVKRVCIVDNTTAGKGKKEDEIYKYLRKEIYEFATEKLIVKTPVTWVLFRKVLKVLVRESKKNVVTLEYARAVGVACKINPEDIPAALMFYHELGVVLFYPHIQGLRDKVILSPKWFVDCLGKVLTLHESEDCENLQLWKLLREKGILVQPLYVAAWKDCEGIEAEEIMQLLVEFHLAAEVKIEEYRDSSVKQFFLPAVLPAFTEDYFSVPPGYHFKATSLHITFATGYVTPGFFIRLVAIMAGSPECQLFYHKTIPIFHNRITFQFGDPPVDRVILTEMPPAVQVDVLRYVTTGTIPMQTLCHNLKEFLKTCCLKVEECLQSITYSHFGIDDRSTRVSKIRREFKFLCCNPKCKSSSEPHYIVPSLKGQTCDLPFFCDASTVYRQLTHEEACWFPEEIKETQQPHITISGTSSQMPVLQPVTSDNTESPSFPSLPSPQLVNPDYPVSDLELTKCSRYLHHKLQELSILLDVSDHKVKEMKGRFKTSQLQARGLLKSTTLTRCELYDLLQALELPEAANELRNDSSNTNTQSQRPAVTYQDDLTERTEELFTDTKDQHHEKQVKPTGIDHNGSNPHHILKSHFTSILDAISNTTMLANDLSSVNLITDTVKDKVLTTTNLSRYERASMLMNEVQRSLKVFNKPETLASFCNVLKKQSIAADRVANTMLRELGLDINRTGTSLEIHDNEFEISGLGFESIPLQESPRLPQSLDIDHTAILPTPLQIHDQSHNSDIESTDNSEYESMDDESDITKELLPSEPTTSSCCIL